MRHRIARFASKLELLDEVVRGRNVLHLGAVGEVGRSVEDKVDAAANSVHADITRAAVRCVGIDIDAVAVEALTDAGSFDNLIALDATKIQRDDVPLSSIDVIVAGDIIEHLPDPGTLLRRLRLIADPSTILVVTTPNALGLPQLLRYALGREIEGDDHVCSFNIYTLSNLLTSCGWRLDSAATCYQRRAVSIHSRCGFRLGQLVLKRWPWLGGTLVVYTQPA